MDVGCRSVSLIQPRTISHGQGAVGTRPETAFHENVRRQSCHAETVEEEGLPTCDHEVFCGIRSSRQLRSFPPRTKAVFPVIGAMLGGHVPKGGRPDLSGLVTDYRNVFSGLPHNPGFYGLTESGLGELGGTVREAG